MALSDLSGWAEDKTASGCGAACGAGDKPNEKPAACGADISLQKPLQPAVLATSHKRSRRLAGLPAAQVTNKIGIKPLLV